MGAIHAEEYDKNRRARLVAVADIDIEKAQKLAGRFRIDAYDDAAEMLDEVRPAAATIATSDPAHVGPTLACIQRGVHVLLEKPIATTLADADTIIAAARDGDAKVLVGHVVRFDPRYARAKQLVDAGEIGRVEAIFARRLNQASLQDVLRGRVSVLSFLGVHDFDIMRWFAGAEAVSVHTEAVWGVHRGHGYDVEDMTFTLVRFANGVIGCAELGWIVPAAHPRGPEFKFDVNGARGRVSIDLYDQNLAVCTEDRWYRPDFGHSVGAEVDSFLDCVIEDKQPPITPADARAALEISLAAIQSARGAGIVKLPLSEANGFR